MRFAYLPNGNLSDETTNGDKLFQGAVGVNEYFIHMDKTVPKPEQWRDGDLVFISFERPDNQSAMARMVKVTNGWAWTSNGWETDVDISMNATLKVSFIMKRYSTVSVGQVVADRTSEQISITIHPSSDWVPQGINIDAAEQLQQNVQALETDIEAIAGYKGKINTIHKAVDPINISTLDDRTTTNEQNTEFANTQATDAKTLAQEAYDLAASAQQQENSIGTLYTETDASPDANQATIQAELNAFVLSQTAIKTPPGRAPQNGDTVTVVQTGITDSNGNPLPNENWRFIYGAAGWGLGFQLTVVNLANDIQAGIVKGNNDTTLGRHLLVDILAGEFQHIYVLDANTNAYVDLCDWLNDDKTYNSQMFTSIQTTINDMISGATAVGNALKLNGKYENALNVFTSVMATQDSDGNIISQFYLPRNQGLTQTQADARYLSKQFGIPYFIDSLGLSTEIPTTPPNGIQFQVTSSQAGVPIPLFDFQQSLDFQIELTSANAFDATFQLAFDQDCVVTPQINIYTKSIANGDASFRFISTATLDPQSFLEDTITPIDLKSYFTFIARGDVVRLMPGDLLRIEFTLTFQDSTETVSSLYCTTNYLSFFTMTNIQTVIVSQGNAGAYTQDITAGSWGTDPSGSGQFILTIPQTTHGLDPSQNYIVDVAQQADIGMQQILCPRFIDSNGDITIFANEAFNGTITIAGGVFKPPLQDLEDTASIAVTDPMDESPLGNGATQQAVNQQVVNALNNFTTQISTAINQEAQSRQTQIDDLNSQIQATDNVLAGVHTYELPSSTTLTTGTDSQTITTMPNDGTVFMAGKTLIYDVTGTLGVFIADNGDGTMTIKTIK